MVITSLSKCGNGLTDLAFDKQKTIKLPKATYLQFSATNKNSKIMYEQCNKKDNMELFVEEHEVHSFSKAQTMNKTLLAVLHS